MPCATAVARSRADSRCQHLIASAPLIAPSARLASMSAPSRRSPSWISPRARSFAAATVMIRTFPRVTSPMNGDAARRSHVDTLNPVSIITIVCAASKDRKPPSTCSRAFRQPPAWVTCEQIGVSRMSRNVRRCGSVRARYFTSSPRARSRTFWSSASGSARRRRWSDRRSSCSSSGLPATGMAGSAISACPRSHFATPTARSRAHIERSLARRVSFSRMTSCQSRLPC